MVDLISQVRWSSYYLSSSPRSLQFTWLIIPLVDLGDDGAIWSQDLSCLIMLWCHYTTCWALGNYGLCCEWLVPSWQLQLPSPYYAVVLFAKCSLLSSNALHAHIDKITIILALINIAIKYYSSNIALPPVVIIPVDHSIKPQITTGSIQV